MINLKVILNIVLRFLIQKAGKEKKKLQNFENRYEIEK